MFSISKDVLSWEDEDTSEKSQTDKSYAENSECDETTSLLCQKLFRRIHKTFREIVGSTVMLQHHMTA